VPRRRRRARSPRRGSGGGRPTRPRSMRGAAGCRGSSASTGTTTTSARPCATRGASAASRRPRSTPAPAPSSTRRGSSSSSGPKAEPRNTIAVRTFGPAHPPSPHGPTPLHRRRTGADPPRRGGSRAPDVGRDRALRRRAERAVRDRGVAGRRARGARRGGGGDGGGVDLRRLGPRLALLGVGDGDRDDARRRARRPRRVVRPPPPAAPRRAGTDGRAGPPPRRERVPRRGGVRHARPDGHPPVRLAAGAPDRGARRRRDRQGRRAGGVGRGRRPHPSRGQERPPRRRPRRRHRDVRGAAAPQRRRHPPGRHRRAPGRRPRPRTVTMRALPILALLLAAPAAAQGVLDLPLTGRVMDGAGVLAEATEASLTTLLEAHEAATTNQVVVLTVPGLEGYPVEDVANQL